MTFCIPVFSILTSKISDSAPDRGQGPEKIAYDQSSPLCYQVPAPPGTFGSRSACRPPVSRHVHHIGHITFTSNSIFKGILRRGSNVNIQCYPGLLVVDIHESRSTHRITLPDLEIRKCASAPVFCRAWTGVDPTYGK